MLLRLCYAILLSLVFAFSCIAQEPPKPVLADEHGQIPCDDLLSRLDAYFAELSRDPGSTGLVMVSSTNETKRLAVFRHHLIEAYVRDRGFTSNQIKFVRTRSTENLAVQLWRVPSGAEEPRTENVDMTYTLPNAVRPFMLAVGYSYADGICPEVDRAMVFAEFLKGNPEARGNIVIRERTIRKAWREVERMRKEFRTRYGVPSSRLRFFPRKASLPTNYQEPIVEYWYLP